MNVSMRGGPVIQEERPDPEGNVWTMMSSLGLSKAVQWNVFFFVFFCRLAITNHTCTSSYLQYLKKHISINRRWWWSVSRRLAVLTSASRRVLFCFSPLMIDVLLLVLHSTNLRLSVVFACDFGFQ